MSQSVESHLHPRASFDLADHPMPTGHEEIWRFTPMDRMAPLLDVDADWVPMPVRVAEQPGVEVETRTERPISSRRALVPVDRPSVIAEHWATAETFIDLFGDAAWPVVIELDPAVA